MKARAWRSVIGRMELSVRDGVEEEKNIVEHEVGTRKIRRDEDAKISWYCEICSHYLHWRFPRIPRFVFKRKFMEKLKNMQIIPVLQNCQKFHPAFPTNFLILSISTKFGENFPSWKSCKHKKSGARKTFPGQKNSQKFSKTVLQI